VNLGPPAEHAAMPDSVSSGRCLGLAPYAEPLLNCPSGGHGESVMKLGGRRLSIVPTAQHSTRGHAHPGQGKLSLGVSEPVDDENYISEVDMGFTYPATDALPSLGVELSMAHAQEAGLASEASCSLAGQVPACQVRPGDRPPQDGSSLRIARPAAGGSPSRVHLHVRGDVRAHPCVPRSLCGSEGDHGPADGPLNPMPESQILSMGLSGTSQEHGLILTSVGHRVSGSGRSGADTLSPSPLAHLPDMLHGPGSVEHRVDGSKGRRSGTPLSSPPPHLIAKPVMQHGPSSVEHRVGGTLSVP
jgi:hypothetical protein